MIVVGQLFLYALLALSVVSAALATYAFSVQVRLMRNIGTPHSVRQLVLIVPIKGVGATTDAFLAGLANQKHQNYRIVFAVESEHDLVLPRLRAFRDGFKPDTEIIIAGFSVDTGQKVWNMLAALKNIRTDDELVVFGDADILPPDFWLSHLDWSVNDVGCTVVSGYRLLLPTDNRLGSFIGASANLSVAGGGRPTRAGLAWGGTMAMTPETFRLLNLAKLWQGTISDDGVLGIAARDKHVRVFGERCLLIESPWSASLAEVFGFGVRQFWMFRKYWLSGFYFTLLTLLAPLAGFVAALADIWAGGFAGWLTLACLVVLSEWRWRYRAAAVRAVVGDARMADLRQWLLFDRVGRPLWTVVTIAAFLVAAVKPTITWSGVTYASSAPNKTRIVSRIIPERVPPSKD
jgi:hypothetical protein